MDITTYQKAHRSLALFNASNRYGRIMATGQDAIDLLHRMSTNDLLPLIDKPGSGIQTVLTTEKGRIIDLLNVLSYGKNALLITSGAREEQVIQWLDKYVIMEDAKFEKKTSQISQIMLFGPRAMSFLQHISGVNLSGIDNFYFIETQIHGISLTLQRTHRIIESGWTLFFDSEKTGELFSFLESEIANIDGTVIDEDTYNLLRIEAGIPIAPGELNEKHNPLETTLVQAVSFTKGCYIGQEVIARLDTYDKVQRHLMGVEISEPFENGSLPVPIANADNEQIGEITSLAFSPSMNRSIGLGFIKTAFAIPQMSAKIGEANIAAKLVKLPFELELQ